MGNTQGGAVRRERAGTSDAATFMRPRGYSTVDDECPVQVKIPKPSYNSQISETPSMQFIVENELPVVIKWHPASQNVKKVALYGSWDNWKTPIPLVKSKDDFSTIINLPEGRHEYKFKVDEQWMVDPNQKLCDSASGTQNNFIYVDRRDFHVFEALEKDAQENEATQKKDDKKESDASMKNMRDLPFTQTVPDRSDFEKAHNPPTLPPHLLQVILNKDTPVQCDPNVLPEPNHVMLNHLYALSIKDGVMVLSATHRYKKKYVTTLLYKPI